MLTIHPPEIVERANETILRARFEDGSSSDTLWFSTTKEFGGFLCDERGDAFLVAMLLYAMKRGEDIHLLGPVSERLYYGIANRLMKVIVDMNPGLHQIKIVADTDSQLIDNAKGVGTGFSGGIDSFYTVAEHTSASCPADHRLTHLTFFNVGANGDFGGDKARKIFHQRIDAIRPCVEELNLPLVTLDSNITEILGMKFTATHTYRNIAAALAFQKLFRTYYYSSGHSLQQFRLEFSHPGHYDIYSLAMLSTNSTEFMPSGEIYSRPEKTEIVSDFPLSYKYLNVCAAEATNCSRCFKCQRTMVTLDMLGKLDRYRQVFDLDYYMNHRSKYFARVVSERKRDDYNQEIVDAIKRTHYPVPFGTNLYRYPMAISRFGIDHSPESLKRWYIKSKRP